VPCIGAFLHHARDAYGDFGRSVAEQQALIDCLAMLVTESGQGVV